MNNSKKTLEIGKNYGPIFGIEEEKGTMVFNGNDSWTASKVNGPSMTKVCAGTTKNALEYINTPSVSMGCIR